LKAQTEQKMAEADKIAADSEKLRRVALKWTIQSQKMIQDLQMKKATAAAVTSSNAVKSVSAKTPAKATKSATKPATKAGAKTSTKTGAKAVKTHHPKAVAQQ
jgi:hypothetical protein